MSDPDTQELRPQPGITPEHHARLVQANADAKLYAAEIERIGRTPWPPPLSGEQVAAMGAEAYYQEPEAAREPEARAMTTWSDPDRDHQLGTYEGQHVMEGDSGTLVYNCEPESEDGCFVPVPHDFLGMPVTYPAIEEPGEYAE
jgi:hypothetical protein